MNFITNQSSTTSLSFQSHTIPLLIPFHYINIILKLFRTDCHGIRPSTHTVKYMFIGYMLGKMIDMVNVLLKSLMLLRSGAASIKWLQE